MRFRFSLAASLVLALAGCSDDDATTTPGTQDSATNDAVANDGATDSTGEDTGAADTATADTSTGDGASDAPAAPTCAAYCTAVMASCTGTTNAQYPDEATCLAACAKMTPGTASDTSGDTIGCRVHHAELAKSGGADLHCPHAGAYGAEVCGSPRCDVFCKLATARCTGVSGYTFTDEADCKTKCAAITFDTTKAELDQTKGTLNCLQYHLLAAYSGPDIHCSHLTITTADQPCTP